MADVFGWIGSVLAMGVSIPQLLRGVRRVSWESYALLCAVHVCYGVAGLLNGLYWLTASSAFGLVVAGAILRKAVSA